LFGILSFGYRSVTKAIEEKRERKRRQYEKLIESVFRLLDAKEGKEISEILTNIELSWLYAPDNVLKASYKVMGAFGTVRKDAEFSESIRKNTNARNEFEMAVAELFVAIRRDLRTWSFISERWAKSHVVIYDQGLRNELN
jgi:hypothetical protein